jgi:hypothetical protein
LESAPFCKLQFRRNKDLQGVAMIRNRFNTGNERGVGEDLATVALCRLKTIVELRLLVAEDLIAVRAERYRSDDNNRNLLQRIDCRLRLMEPSLRQGVAVSLGMGRTKRTIVARRKRRFDPEASLASGVMSHTYSWE